MNIQQKIVAAFAKKADKTELKNYIKNVAGDEFIDASIIDQSVNLSVKTVNIKDASLTNDGLVLASDVQNTIKSDLVINGTNEVNVAIEKIADPSDSNVVGMRIASTDGKDKAVIVAMSDEDGDRVGIAAGGMQLVVNSDGAFVNSKKIITEEDVKTVLIDDATDKDTYVETMDAVYPDSVVREIVRNRKKDGAYSEYPIGWYCATDKQYLFSKEEIEAGSTTAILYQADGSEVDVNIQSYTGNAEVNGVASALDVKHHLSDVEMMAEQAIAEADEIAQGIQDSESLHFTDKKINVNTMTNGDVSVVFDEEFYE